MGWVKGLLQFRLALGVLLLLFAILKPWLFTEIHMVTNNPALAPWYKTSTGRGPLPPAPRPTAGTPHRAPSGILLSVVTPTVRREECEYIFILASSIWMNTPPDRVGTTVGHWTILNGDRDITPESALGLVEERFVFPLLSWWSILPAPHYENLDRLAAPIDKYRTPLDQRKWRTKESLDYISCLEMAVAAVPDCTHVLVIEDDFLPAGNWVEMLENHVEEHGKDGIHALWDCRQQAFPGTVAILWERTLVEDFIKYFKANISKFPVDWAIGNFLKDRKIEYKIARPSLGQHIGFKSSLESRKERLIAPHFGDNGWVESPSISPKPPTRRR